MKSIIILLLVLVLSATSVFAQGLFSTTGSSTFLTTGIILVIVFFVVKAFTDRFRNT